MKIISVSSFGATALLVSFLITASSSANAVSVFLDDFEDLNHDGWSVTASGGGGSNGVEFINESNRAFVSKTQSGKHSLSKEFDYQPGSVLSFDMQTLANTGRGSFGGTTHAASGVTVSFETSFNVELGEVSFVFATSTSLLPSNSFAISNTQDSFEAEMSEWADLALVDSGANTKSIALEFWAIGQTAQVGGSAATSRVRFDNVQVQVVPIPAAVWFFTSGLGLLGWKRLFNIA